MTKNREVLRTCVVCKNQFDKRSLLRVVKVSDTEVVLDISGKMNGRGAYISTNDECLSDKSLRFRLQNALKVKFSEEDFEKLLTDIKEGAMRE